MKMDPACLGQVKINELLRFYSLPLILKQDLGMLPQRFMHLVNISVSNTVYHAGEFGFRFTGVKTLRKKWLE
ncbi:unnamed protein product [Dibothriocephalus latus]|uniref:Uncharacterized protein n=1 Tax=Dibothriocephalus latus TaxID=60516 RepID=A0A3P7N7W3_DIBLA|nr:unnamed protein product [Dibothriocephalus latus]